MKDRRDIKAELKEMREGIEVLQYGVRGYFVEEGRLIYRFMEKG